MRTSTVLSVLFAASALAVPVNNKRVLIEDIVVVTVTDFVYPDGSPATPPAVPAPAASPAAAPAPAPAPAQDSSPHTLFKAPKPTEEPAAPAAPSPAPAPVETHAPAPPSPAPAPVETHAPAPVSAPAPVPTPAPAPSPVAPAPVNGAPHTLVPNLDVTSPTYAAIALAHHNAHRSNHSAPDVGYNQTIADWAQKKAESCVWNEDMYVHLKGMDLGRDDLSANVTQACRSFRGWHEHRSGYIPRGW
jgi:outer membrane biosynthesis protein TonB